MKNIGLLILFSTTLTSFLFPMEKLEYAIMKSDLKAAKVAVSGLSLEYATKVRLLDFAQEMITKRRDEVFIKDTARLPFYIKGIRIAGLVGITCGALSTCARLIFPSTINKENTVGGFSTLIYGVIAAKLSHDYLTGIDKQYEDAVAIKQLIYNS